MDVGWAHVQTSNNAENLKSQKSNFFKSHDFLTHFFVILDFFSKMYNFWHVFTWLTPKKGGLLSLTFDKNQSKKIFLKKIVKKLFFVRFQQILN